MTTTRTILRSLIAVAAIPVVVAGVAGVRFTARAAAARRRGTSLEAGVPTPAPTPALAGAVALDTLVNLPMGLLASIGSPEQYSRASDELDAAVAHYATAGWLDDPARRHRAPTDVPEGRVDEDTDLLRFDSGWQPDDDEPGGDRWRSFSGNQVVPARLLRHPGGPRPWLVVVHGQGMGRPSDLRVLGARRLHEQLGVNLALPALPLHGPRAAGFASDRQFVSNVFLVNNVLGLTQAVWDLRRLLMWLRADQEAPAVGVLGVSLGSYACSLLSTVEADLACLIAVVPTSDLAGSLRAAEPTLPSRRRLHRALHDDRSRRLHHVVSPVARPCLVPHDRRFVVAGQADRVAAPTGAAALWSHWGEPSIDWLPSGHVTSWRGAAYNGRIAGILTATGLSAGAQRRGH